MLQLNLAAMRDLRAWTELILYSITFIYISITYAMICRLKKVRFITIMLTILLVNSIQGIYSGVYWSEYFPGPYTADNPKVLTVYNGIA